MGGGVLGNFVVRGGNIPYREVEGKFYVVLKVNPSTAQIFHFIFLQNNQLFSILFGYICFLKNVILILNSLRKCWKIVVQ